MNFFEEDIEQQNTDEPVIQEDNLAGVTGQPLDDNGSYVISSKSSSRNTYLLLGVCLLAIVGVWFAGFHQKSAEQESKDDPAQKLDLVLAKLVGIKNTNDSQELVEAFYELPGGKQVKLEELNKNPFMLEQKTQESVESPVVKQVERQKVLTAEIESLKLGTIMKRPGADLCLINGLIYKVGDKVTESFEVKEIKVDTVILEAEDWKCELGM